MALKKKEKNEKELKSKSDAQTNTKPQENKPKKSSILSEPSAETQNQPEKTFEKTENIKSPNNQNKKDSSKKTSDKEQDEKNTIDQDKPVDENEADNNQNSNNIKNTEKENKQNEEQPNQIQEKIEEQSKNTSSEAEISTEINNEPTFDSNNPTALKPVTLGKQIFKIIENILFTLVALAALAFTIFTIANTDNSTISNGISILGVDVSGLDKTAATDKISAHIKDSLENDIILKHNEYETNIGPEQLETQFNIESAVTAAFDIGSGNNIFLNGYKKFNLIINPVDIEPDLSINQEQLESALSVISTQLPDAVIQSDYYIDGNNLIVTAGRDGVIVNISTMKTIINEQLSNLSYINKPIEIATISQTPDKIDIEKLYSEIHKDAVDARYDAETHIVYPEENGLDFDISLDEAKTKIAEIPQECTIPLKVLRPNITTNMIGMEAFPDVLGSFSTKYPVSNKGRTTNLKLAADKVNGTVLLPGETFSYNSVVGERTIAAGYKEAAVYQDGQVVQGLGGGICQISSTLYNAALYANLEIVERRNHQFVPSYVGAGRDATVVYGSQDFKFKNNRNYAIKITCSVEGGVASFNIYGLAEENEYEVTISSNITSRNANSFTSATYKTLKQNGEVISSETVSRDTYKSH